MQLQFNFVSIVIYLIVFQFDIIMIKITVQQNANLTIVWKLFFFPLGIFLFHIQGDSSGGMDQGEFSSKDKEHVR